MDGPAYDQAEDFILNKLKTELPEDLTYHNVAHTLDVLGVSMQIADTEGIPENEKKLLRIAALFHDAGFIYCYKEHEEKSCSMAKEYLPGFRFSEEQIEVICGLIMTTQVPQIPATPMGRVIADADLDYLGRADVLEIATRLYDELKLYHFISEEQWIPFQIAFLEKHHYFTPFSKRFREPEKNKYLQSLILQLKK